MSKVIRMELIRGALEYTAEEMGIALRNAAYSANIKERMDHSCAIFDADGRLIAQAEHIPVHLGAMPVAVKKVINEMRFDDGDYVIFNDPYYGGTHLPDITLITPFFYEGKLICYLVNRAHHSDVGGKVPGSMPGDATEIFEEGLIIPPVKLMKRGKLDNDVLKLLMANSRTPLIRRGDIMAQIASNNIGLRRLKSILDKFGVNEFIEGVNDLLNYSERRISKIISEFPEKRVYAEDYLDDYGTCDEPVKIAVEIIIKHNEIIFDFSKSQKEVEGPINAPRSVTLSASYFVLRAVTDPTIPINEGTYRPLRVITKKGTVVDATFPRAVSGGNVETSQRIVDVLLKGFAEIIPEKIPAACQGTMNNITIGGTDPRTGNQFTFYETIGGGFGGRFGLDGIDGVHSNMTNTMNTPIEEIEKRFPILIIKYELRKNSGGLGESRGGLGIERVYKILARGKLSVMGDRQKFAPWGLRGGLPGAKGEYLLVREGKVIRLRSKGSVNIKEGDIIIIRTPGGGGYGDPKKRDKGKILNDILDEKYDRDYIEQLIGKLD